MRGKIKNTLSCLLVVLLLLGSLPIVSVSANESVGIDKSEIGSISTGTDEDYYTAYKEVLESYYSIASGLSTSGNYGDYHLYHGQGYIYRFGYTFLDYDNNGIKELIFSSSENSGLIYEMYTLVNGKVKKVLGSWERCSYWFCGNGVIYEHGSNGAFTGTNGLFQYYNGKLKTIEDVYMDVYPNTEKNIYYFITYSDTKTPFVDQELTRDEWQSKITEYENMTTPIPVTPLYGYDDIFFASNQYNEVNRNGFRYKISDGEVTITGYFGSSTEAIIPEVIEGYPVIYIGNRAFSECSIIKNIKISSSIISIGTKAFCDCSVNEFNVDADNSALISVDGVLFSKDKSELVCYPAGSDKTTYTIPESVRIIRPGALDYSSNLTSVIVPNNVTNADTLTFRLCSNLESVKLPDNITTICDSAFSGCSKLNNIIIPDGVAKIGYMAFNTCESLTSITIPDSVTTIDSEAFKDCTSLDEIKLPDNITDISYSAFFNTAYYNNESNWEKGVLYIDSYLIEAKDTISGNYAVKDGTKTIATHAFYGCKDMTGISIPDSVTSIDSQEFDNCTNLTSVKIPQYVLDSFSYYFNKKNIESVIILEGATSVPGNAFNFCTNLKSVIIPDGVTSIGHFAFSGCESLENISIPDSLTSIGNYAFSGCESLENISIPNNVTTIEKDTFLNCTSLKEISLPDTLTYVGEHAFMATAYFEDETNWDNGDLYIDNYLISVDYNASDYIVKDGTNLIAEKAFTYCQNLNSITIPYSVKYIADFAVWDCPQDITIYGYTGTAAETYADRHNYTFISLEGYKNFLGDANEDETVNIKDATAIQKHIANLITLTEKGVKLADVDSSGGINIKDATAIQKHIAGIDTGLGIGSTIA